LARTFREDIVVEDGNLGPRVSGEERKEQVGDVLVLSIDTEEGVGATCLKVRGSSANGNER
jgi:hypothetical protein